MDQRQCPPGAPGPRQFAVPARDQPGVSRSRRDERYGGRPGQDREQQDDRPAPGLVVASSSSALTANSVTLDELTVTAS